MPESSSNEKFLFNSIAGWSLCRKILLEKLPFCPHDYQLNGISAVLDGKDLLAISATGSGIVLPKFCSELLRRTRTDRTEP
jgi:hypothetical protein